LAQPAFISDFLLFLHCSVRRRTGTAGQKQFVHNALAGSESGEQGKNKEKHMSQPLLKLAPLTAVLVGSLGLGGCATKGFVREQVAVVNQRVDALDAKLATTDQTAQQALAQAQAAGGQAQQNSQRLDQLNGRVDGVEQQMQAARTKRARN
jgi:murein lipoprotein